MTNSQTPAQRSLAKSRCLQIEVFSERVWPIYNGPKVRGEVGLQTDIQIGEAMINIKRVLGSVAFTCATMGNALAADAPAI